MAGVVLRFVDRLQERGLIDRWGFLGFAAIGSFIILAAKRIGIPAEIVALIAIAIMAIYALLVSAKGTGKLRSDQAGDNCYYLGLIFTLTSLAYAIFTFDPINTATTIVQGFGVALATTIVGLVLRVFFNQSRVDLFEVEDTARLELAEAAGRLKTELSQIAVQFSHFAIGLQQSVAEVRDEASESLDQTVAQSMKGVQALADEVRDLLRSHSEELARNTSSLSERTAAVSSAITRHGKSIDKLAAAHELIVADISNMAEATKNMSAQSAAMIEQTRQSRETQERTSALIGSVDEAGKRIHESFAQSLSIIQRFERDFADRLKELESGPKETSDRALDAIARAANSVEAAMNRLTAAQEAAIGSVSNTTSELLKAVQEHNAELEKELTRSRGNVQKVHGALVEMTARLNEAVR